MHCRVAAGRPSRDKGTLKQQVQCVHPHPCQCKQPRAAFRALGKSHGGDASDHATQSNSLSGEGAIEVQWHVLACQQASGEEEAAVRACWWGGEIRIEGSGRWPWRAGGSRIRACSLPSSSSPALPLTAALTVPLVEVLSSASATGPAASGFATGLDGGLLGSLGCLGRLGGSALREECLCIGAGECT
jgi:hypothetical protein